MALTKADQLFNDVQRARMDSMRRQRRLREQIEQYHGVAYMGRDGLVTPENVSYGFIVHLMSRLVSTTPRVQFTTKRDVATERVEALEMFNERWRRETNYMRERERAILDMCFGTAILLCSQGPAPGFEQSDDPPYRPSAVRVPSALWGIDMEATCADDARFMFHVVIMPKDRFLRMAREEDGWDMQSCQELVAQSTEKERARSEPDKHGSSDPRNIVYYHVWCPFDELEPDDSFWKGKTERERSRYHGVVRTIAPSTSGAGYEIRKAVPYFGPRPGPYATDGFLQVPDEPWHLGPLSACDGQIRQLNAQARANDRSAENRKRVALFNGNTPDGKLAVLNAIDGDALAIPGFDPATVTEIEIGGISAEARAREMELRVRVDRALGMSDPQRGEVSGVGTATENAIASESSNAVLGLWKSRIAALDGAVALRMAWYADQDERTVLRYHDQVFLGGSNSQEQLAALEIAKTNGLVDEPTYEAAKMQLELRVPQDESGEGGSFDDLEIEVELLGDDGRDEQRMTYANQMLAQWLPILPQVALYSPGLKDFFARAAEALKIPELRDIADFKVAAEIGLAMMQQDAEAAGGVAPGVGPKPRLSGKTGWSGRNPSARPEGQATKLRQSGGNKPMSNGRAK